VLVRLVLGRGAGRAVLRSEQVDPVPIVAAGNFILYCCVFFFFFE
jgi:hypothetical protein